MRIDHPIGYYARMTGSFTGSFYGNLNGFIDSASFATTASYAYYAISASHEITFEVSSSYAQTASYTEQADTASFAVTASYLLGTTDSASFALTASYVEQAISSSYAVTASYVQSVESASYASTASYVVNAISSSYAATSSITDTAISASHVATAITSLSGSDSDTVYGVQMGGGISSIVINNVDTALTASYVISSSYAVTASYVESVESASYAITSSYSDTTISASYALTASYLDGLVESNAALVYTGSRGNIIPISGGHYIAPNDDFLYSTVLGGLSNTASGSYATIAGGDQNISANSHTFVGGGDRNCAFGLCSNVVGGTLNRTYGSLSTIVGGYSNCATGSYAFIGGGYFHKAGGSRSYIGGGQSNTITAAGLYGTIGGGRSHCVDGCQSTVAGGYQNRIFTGNATVGGGFANHICSTSTNAGAGTIGGGIRNCILDSGCYAVIAGGRCSNTSGDYSSILGGCENTMTGGYSSIIGGCLNTNSHTNSHVIGSNITTDKNDYTFVNNLDNQGSTFLRGETQVKDDLFVMNTAMSAKHVHLESNGTEGTLKLNNGANWGLIARGQQNTPHLGAYYGTGGQLSIRGYGQNDGAANVNDKDIMKFVFSPSTNSPHVEITDYKSSGTEALRINFPNNTGPGGGAEWISFWANGSEFDTIEGDTAGGALFTGNAAGTTSDLRNKKDIVPVTDTANSLEIVKGLEVIEFAYKTDTREVPKRKIGFSAQQLLEVYPHPVTTFEDKNKENNLKPGDPGFKYHKVSEGALTPLLVSAIQEQQKIIEELRQEIDSLKNT